MVSDYGGIIRFRGSAARTLIWPWPTDIFLSSGFQTKSNFNREFSNQAQPPVAIAGVVILFQMVLGQLRLTKKGNDQNKAIFFGKVGGVFTNMEVEAIWI